MRVFSKQDSIPASVRREGGFPVRNDLFSKKAVNLAARYELKIPTRYNSLARRVGDKK